MAAAARIIDFNKLPKSVRERLIGCIAGNYSPRPLLAERFSQAGTVGWILLALLSGAVLLGLVAYGFASPYSDGSVQSPALLLLYIGAAFLGAYSLLATLRRIKTKALLPFTPGRYLFPMDFVDARSRTLRILPLGSLIDLQAVHHHTNGVYSYTQFSLTFEGGGVEAFTMSNKAMAEAALQNLRAQRAAIGEAVQNRQIEVIQALDPFFDVRINDAWDNPTPEKGFEPGPMAGEVPAWLQKAAVVALAPAVVLAPLVWFVRNHLSDNTMFEDAKEQNTERAFESYLYHGKRHAEDVRANYIWKAALADANKEGTSVALRAFLRKYPDSPASNEIRTETLPRLALKEAQAKGTVSALREFQKEFPGSVVDAEAKKSVHDLFVSTLAAFRPQAATTDPKMLPFVERLLVYLEAKESPDVKVSFRIVQSPSLALADKLLASKTPGLPAVAGVGGGGTVAAASSHFSEARSVTREAAIVTVLQQAFGKIFPSDVLNLAQGERRSDATPKGATVSEPTIDIDYEVGWSGSTYSSETSGREFVGIKIDFQAAMRLPGEPEKEALRFKLAVEPPEHFTVNYSSPFIDKSFLEKAGPTDTTVYEVMASRAFDQLSQKLRGVFFKEGSTAFGGTGSATGSAVAPKSTKPAVPDFGATLY
jgi:hypothetical protein